VTSPRSFWPIACCEIRFWPQSLNSWRRNLIQVIEQFYLGHKGRHQVCRTIIQRSHRPRGSDRLEELKMPFFAFGFRPQGSQDPEQNECLSIKPTWRYHLPVLGPYAFLQGSVLQAPRTQSQQAALWAFCGPCSVDFDASDYQICCFWSSLMRRFLCICFLCISGLRSGLPYSGYPVVLRAATRCLVYYASFLCLLIFYSRTIHAKKENDIFTRVKYVVSWIAKGFWIALTMSRFWNGDDTTRLYVLIVILLIRPIVVVIVNVPFAMDLVFREDKVTIPTEFFRAQSDPWPPPDYCAEVVAAAVVLGALQARSSLRSE